MLQLQWWWTKTGGIGWKLYAGLSRVLPACRYCMHLAGARTAKNTTILLFLNAEKWQTARLDQIKHVLITLNLKCPYWVLRAKCIIRQDWLWVPSNESHVISAWVIVDLIFTLVCDICWISMQKSSSVDVWFSVYLLPKLVLLFN